MMRKWLAKPKWMLFWGFLLCMLIGPYIGFHTLEHGLSHLFANGLGLVKTGVNAVLHVFGHHGLSVKAH